MFNIFKAIVEYCIKATFMQWNDPWKFSNGKDLRNIDGRIKNKC